MLRYGITQRRLLPELDLDRYLELAFRTSADIVQWREKDLPVEVNRSLLGQGRKLARQTGRRLVVNGDVQLALELGLDGVHLTSTQNAATVLKALPRPRTLWVGQSVHSCAEALTAAQAGVDYLLAAPVFAPISKQSDGPCLGLAGLNDICRVARIPVIALGGITPAHWDRLSAIPGVIGIAGISWFTEELRALAAGS